MPAYDRPILAGRAIESLRAQDHQDWICRVFDDSPDDRVKSVVEAFGDSRILYRRNCARLGAAANVNQAFAKEALDGTHVFCVLEDDNYLLPSFMTENLAALEASGVELLLRNQLVESFVPGQANGDITGETTLAPAFADEVYPALACWGSLLFEGGVSNGGLVWTAEAKSKFDVACPGSDAVLDEVFRTILVSEPIRVAMTPLAVFRDNGAETRRWEDQNLRRRTWRHATVLTLLHRYVLLRLSERQEFASHGGKDLIRTMANYLLHADQADRLERLIERTLGGGRPADELLAALRPKGEAKGERASPDLLFRQVGQLLEGHA